MKVGIKTLSLDGPLLEMAPEEFEHLKRARRGFMVLREIEEKLDLVLENFAEYEQELLSLTLRRTLFWDLSWSSFVNDINLINRRLANLLTTGRLYLDQVKGDIHSIYNRDGPVSQGLNKRLAEVYDAKFGYRVMEALRNHMQHRGLPITGVNYPTKREGSSGARRLRWRIAPYLDVDVLRGNEGFKKSILKELEIRGPKVVIIPLVREYVEGIGCVHDYLREATSKDLSEWVQQLEGVIRSSRTEFGDEDMTGVTLVTETDPESDSVEGAKTEQIFTDLLERHKFLAGKNLSLKNLALHFVSGEHIELEAE
jgi:hypothetical protein